MKRFDDFKFLFNTRAELLEKGAGSMMCIIEPDMELEYSDADWFVAQMIYFHYIVPYGYDFLYSKTTAFDSKKQEIINHLLRVCKHFEKESKEEFSDTCSYLKIPVTISPLIRYIPCNTDTLKHFIRDFASSDSIKDFVIGLSALITFEMYRGDETDIKHLDYCFTIVLEELRKHPIFASQSLQTIKHIKDKAILFCKKLNLECGVEYSTHHQFQQNGVFELPWKYVTFAENKIFIYHPSEYNSHTTHPLIIYNKKSRSAFNNIKPYLSRIVSGIYVIADNGRIAQLSASADILECVDILHQRMTYNKTKRTIGNKAQLNKKTPQEDIIKKIRQVKSKYLDYLCDIHLPEYNIYYCPENRVNTDIQIDEDGFIFTLKKSEELIKIVYENISDDRSTIVILMPRQNHQTVVDKVCEYFTSNTINKRERISMLQQDLKSFVYICKKVIHTNLKDWKRQIIEL